MRLVPLLERVRYTILVFWVVVAYTLYSYGFAGRFLDSTSMSFDVPQESYWQHAVDLYRQNFPLRDVHYDVPMLVLLEAKPTPEGERDVDLTRSGLAETFTNMLQFKAGACGTCFSLQRCLLRKIDGYWSSDTGPLMRDRYASRDKKLLVLE